MKMGIVDILNSVFFFNNQWYGRYMSDEENAKIWGLYV